MSGGASLPLDFDGEGSQTVVLRPGSILYVPAGYWHSVEAEDETGSLSLNFSISGARWVDIFMNKFIPGKELLTRS